jgi:hypothetical protein
MQTTLNDPKDMGLDQLQDPKDMGLDQLLELINHLITKLPKGHKGKHLHDNTGKFLVVEKKGTLCVFRITHMRLGCSRDRKHRCHIMGYEELCLEGNRPTIFSKVGEQTGSGEFWYHPHGRMNIKPLTDFFDKLKDGMIPPGEMTKTHKYTPKKEHAKYFGDKSKCSFCKKR